MIAPESLYLRTARLCRAPASPLPAAARAQRHSQAAQGEREAIVADMARLSVEAGAVARAAKAAGKEREGRLVEVDVWKLEVRRLRTLLSRWVHCGCCVRVGW